MSVGFAATPELMRTVASEILAQADQLNESTSAFDGGQDILAGAANGFALIRAAVDLENGWVAALDAVGIKVAVDADNLALSAESYAATDAGGVRRLAGR